MSTSHTVPVTGESNRRSSVLSFAYWLLKAAGLWIVLLVGSALALKIVGATGPVPPQDGPLTSGQAFLAVNGAVALALALVAARVRIAGVRMAMVLFVALFCIQTGMALIETWWFNNAVHMPPSQIFAWGEEALIVSALIGAAAALLFRPRPEPAAAVPSNLWVRILLLTVIYVVLYYAAGFFIAWQSEAVRDYYTTHGANIPGFTPTIALQFGRGILWALIALFIVSQLKGSLFGRALVMMVLFSVVTATQLLYPNPLMPWPVRQMHLIEIASSEAVYGIVATLVLLAGATRRPLSETSAWRLIAGRA